MAIAKKGKYYYLYFREGGKIRWLATGQTVESEARKLDRANSARLLSEKQRAILKKLAGPDAAPDLPQPPPAEPQHKRGTVKLADMLSMAGKYRPLSRSHKSAITLFIARTGLKYADQVTPQVARNYLVKYYGDGNGKSYNNARTYLNTIFRLLLIETGLTASPFASLVPRRIEGTKGHRPITQEEFRRLFNAAEEPFKTALLLSYHTGLRLKDCLSLRWEEITGDGWIRRIPAKTARYHRAVEIPIHPELLSHLSGLPHVSEYICFNAPHQTTVINKFSELFKSCSVLDTDAGKASFHSLRSSFITRCDEAGIPRHATRGAAGQRSDQITDVYSHDRVTPLRIKSLPNALS